MSLIVNDDDNKVYVATVSFAGKRAGFVITWVSEASLNRLSPKIILIVSKFSSTLELMLEAGNFCLNLLSCNQLKELTVFGMNSSAYMDKFLSFTHMTKGPYIELNGCSGYAHCAIDSIYETFDRKILYCSIKNEHITSLRPMVLSDALARLAPEQKRELEEKKARETLRDESQFPLSH